LEASKLLAILVLPAEIERMAARLATTATARKRCRYEQHERRGGSAEHAASMQAAGGATKVFSR
jgi:hypothetical protein